MTTPPSTPATPPQGSAAAEQLSLSLIRLTRAIVASKDKAARVHPDVDPMVYPVLFRLCETPRRLTQLAEITRVDLSVLSRQMTALTQAGLVARVEDPKDRRAQLLSLTPHGRSVLDQLQQQREQWIADLVADWSDEEVATFAAHLSRFAEAVETRNHG